MLRTFWSSRAGNVGMLFPIVALPLMMSVGMAIDYGHLTTIERRMAKAADAAAVAAISHGSDGFDAALAKIGTGRVPEAESIASTFFTYNLASFDGVETIQANPVVNKTPQAVVSEIDYSVEVPLIFGRFFGMEHRPVSGYARAEISLERAIDFYLLLDNTPSMGVAATLADIATLENKTGCAFACHQMDKAKNNYTIAKSLGVAMRIDLVRQATQRLTETAEAMRQHSDQFRMAVYSFGKKAEHAGFTQTAALSSDLAKVRSQTAALDLMTIPYQNYKDDKLTAFDDTLKAANLVIPKPGSGAVGEEPQKVLFFVTDGVADHHKPFDCAKSLTMGSRCQEPIDTQHCEAIKAKGVKIAVLYTEYLPLPSDGWYNTWIAPFSKEISPALEACASHGLFFEVGIDGGIEEAMKALFVRTISSPRLTN